MFCEAWLCLPGTCCSLPVWAACFMASDELGSALAIWSAFLFICSSAFCVCLDKTVLLVGQLLQLVLLLLAQLLGLLAKIVLGGLVELLFEPLLMRLDLLDLLAELAEPIEIAEPIHRLANLVGGLLLAVGRPWPSHAALLGMLLLLGRAGLGVGLLLAGIIQVVGRFLHRAFGRLLQLLLHRFGSLLQRRHRLDLFSLIFWRALQLLCLLHGLRGCVALFAGQAARPGSCPLHRTPASCRVIA